jgi:hypothetical protein
MMNATETTQGTAPASEKSYLPHGELRKHFTEWWTGKTEERKEAATAEQYYNMVQWTADELKELKRRKQPAFTTPIFRRKVDGFVGLIDRMRQDPKAYPRSLKHNEAADLCTAALRYALDAQMWPDKDNEVLLSAAIKGIAGVELSLEPGDTGEEGDFDITVNTVDPDYFFYDPRSEKPDFSDARFMGVSKWMDLDAAKEMFPEKADEIELSGGATGDEFATEENARLHWANTELKQVRIVEHWYRHEGSWCYAIYTGRTILVEGETYLTDEKGRPMCRYIMFGPYIDHDHDRYSFYRMMKPLVDEINQRTSKALHLLNMRRIIADRSAFLDEDLEKMRLEAAKPDGIIVYNPGSEFKFDDAASQVDFAGQLNMLTRAKEDLENIGPNPALVGTGVENRSGRAIQMMQQSGLAELGPFLRVYKTWKLRVYRAIWNMIRQHWTGERMIRVYGENGEETVMPVNAKVNPQTMAPEVDPMTGMPKIFNHVGALDVEIVLDEGPDTMTTMGEALETLQAAASQGQQIPPEVMLELLPLPEAQRRKLLGKLEAAKQPNPAAGEREALELAQLRTELSETKAKVMLIEAQAAKARADAQVALAETEHGIRMSMMGADPAMQASAPAAPAPPPQTGPDMQVIAEAIAMQGQAIENGMAQMGMGLQELARSTAARPSEGEGLQMVLTEVLRSANAPKRVIRDAGNRVVGVESIGV